MRTVKLKTGVEITFNNKDEIISVYTPYYNSEPYKMSILTKLKQLWKH